MITIDNTETAAYEGKVHGRLMIDSQGNVQGIAVEETPRRIQELLNEAEDTYQNMTDEEIQTVIDYEKNASYSEGYQDGSEATYGTDSDKLVKAAKTAEENIINAINEAAELNRRYTMFAEVN